MERKKFKVIILNEEEKYESTYIIELRPNGVEILDESRKYENKMTDKRVVSAITRDLRRYDKYE